MSDHFFRPVGPIDRLAMLLPATYQQIGLRTVAILLAGVISIGCNSHPACDSTLKNNDLRRMLAFALSVHV